MILRSVRDEFFKILRGVVVASVENDVDVNGTRYQVLQWFVTLIFESSSSTVLVTLFLSHLVLQLVLKLATLFF